MGPGLLDTKLPAAQKNAHVAGLRLDQVLTSTFLAKIRVSWHRRKPKSIHMIPNIAGRHGPLLRALDHNVK